MLQGLYSLQIYRSVEGKPMRAYATTNGREESILKRLPYQVDYIRPLIKILSGKSSLEELNLAIGNG